MAAKHTTAILHIGIEKTGTTSIQSDLAHHRAYLAEHGIRYPSMLHSQNHFQIAVPGIAPESGNKLLEWAKVHEMGHESYVAQLRGLIQGRVRPGSTWIFSSEFLTSQVSSLREISRIRSFLLSCGFERFKLIALLRKPQYLAHSRYVTALRAGSIAPAPKVAQPGRIENTDFSRSVELWRLVFGRESLHAMAYPERSASDVLYRKFYAAVGIPAPEDSLLNSERRENTGLPPTIAEALRTLNCVALEYLPAGEQAAFRKAAAAALRGHAAAFSGEKWLDRGTAEHYAQEHAEHLSQVTKLMPPEEARAYLEDRLDALPEKAATVDPGNVTAVVNDVLDQLSRKFCTCPKRFPAQHDPHTTNAGAPDVVHAS